MLAKCGLYVLNLDGLFPVVLHQQNVGSQGSLEAIDTLRISPAQITPSVDFAMFFFGTNALHFSEEFYGTVLLIDGIAQVMGVSPPSELFQVCSNCLMLPERMQLAVLEAPPGLMADMLSALVTAEAIHWMLSAGVAIYNTFLRSVALKKVFFWSALVLIGVHLMQLVLVTGGHNYMNQYGITSLVEVLSTCNLPQLPQAGYAEG